MEHSKHYGFVTYRRDVVEDGTHKRVPERRLQSLSPEILRGINQSPEQNTLDLYEATLNIFGTFKFQTESNISRLPLNKLDSELADWVHLKAKVMEMENGLNPHDSKANELYLTKLKDHFFVGQITLKSACFGYFDQQFSEEDDESLWEELSDSPEAMLREEAKALEPEAEAMDLLGWLLTAERWFHNTCNPRLYKIDRLLEIVGAEPGGHLYTPRLVGNASQKKTQYQYVEDCDEDL